MDHQCYLTFNFLAIVSPQQLHAEELSKILAFLVSYYKILYQGSVEFRLVILNHSKGDHLFARKVHTHPLVKSNVNTLRKDA